MSVTYEITAEVRADLDEQYERYMIDRHIPDLMATGAFVSASLSRSSPGRYRVRYEAVGRDALNAYLRDHAPRLREHFSATLPDGISLSREEWDVLKTFRPAA
ncbi:MAG: DUF4286 family protein [Pyrinomonadaceae bacterium]